MTKSNTSQIEWKPMISDGELIYFPNFLNFNKANKLFFRIKNTITWN